MSRLILIIAGNSGRNCAENFVADGTCQSGQLISGNMRLPLAAKYYHRLANACLRQVSNVRHAVIHANAANLWDPLALNEEFRLA